MVVQPDDGRPPFWEVGEVRLEPASHGGHDFGLERTPSVSRDVDLQRTHWLLSRLAHPVEGLRDPQIRPGRRMLVPQRRSRRRVPKPRLYSRERLPSLGQRLRRTDSRVVPQVMHAQIWQPRKVPRPVPVTVER